VTVACEPTGHRWRVLDQLASERGLPLVCVQPGGVKLRRFSSARETQTPSPSLPGPAGRQPPPSTRRTTPSHRRGSVTRRPSTRTRTPGRSGAARVR
jgi:hypothetical protein